MTVTFQAIEWPDDADAVVDFLTSNEWPFHGQPHPSPADASAIEIVGDDLASFWIRDDGTAIGMIRLFDLDDLDTGSPLFDLRVAESHRGRGVGRSAVGWLTDHLFTTAPQLHRIEATTRHDNLAMQAVLAHCGYRCEGRLVEAWHNSDGTRHDTLVYAILRREWAAEPGERAARG